MTSLPLGAKLDGAALPEAGGVNLLPAPRRIARRRRARVRAWSWIGAAYLLAVAGASAAFVLTTHEGGPRVADVDEAVARVAARRIEVAALEKELTAATRNWEAARAVGHHPDWSVLLGLLARAREGEVVLERCELRADVPSARAQPQPGRRQYTLSVDGIARSQRAVPAYVLGLERLGVFESVTIIETRSRPPDTGTSAPADPAVAEDLVAFRVQATLADRASGARP